MRLAPSRPILAIVLVSTGLFACGPSGNAEHAAEITLTDAGCEGSVPVSLSEGEISIPISNQTERGGWFLLMRLAGDVDYALFEAEVLSIQQELEAGEPFSDSAIRMGAQVSPVVELEPGQSGVLEADLIRGIYAAQCAMLSAGGFAPVALYSIGPYVVD